MLIIEPTLELDINFEMGEITRCPGIAIHFETENASILTVCVGEDTILIADDGTHIPVMNIHKNMIFGENKIIDCVSTAIFAVKIRTTKSGVLHYGGFDFYIPPSKKKSIPRRLLGVLRRCKIPISRTRADQQDDYQDDDQ